MERVLPYIQNPSSINKLSPIEIELLCEELRQRIISTVAINGGHLAPSLGVVELTVALYSVFNQEKDKIIWDVGHQAYAHKLLTGRQKQFLSLRQGGGISGFPKRLESKYDYFGTGHSSTSISASLGYAIAHNHDPDKPVTCAVIGDGSLTAGIAFEALNHAGQLGQRLVVVLNDNEMSISRNVGALSLYLTRLRSDPKYFRLKNDIEFLLKRIPAIGAKVARTAERVKDALRYILVPGTLFEELGFTYFGPLDGHNVTSLKEVFEHIRQIEGPTLVHVLTKKGRGYPPAEASPDKYHGIGPFDVDSGLVLTPAQCSYTSVFGESIVKLAEKNPNVVAICAAMPDGTGLTKFAQRFPNRFFDVGIAEQHAVTLAAGFSAAGKKPVVAIYSTFLQRAYDQIIHDVCLQNLPVVFCLDRAGFVGEDGATHQGLFDISYLRHIPNMTIVAPRDAAELDFFLNESLKQDGPVAIRYPRAAAEITPMLKETQWGKGVVLKNGSSGMVLAIGSMVLPSLRAAEQLKATIGLDIGVTDVRFIKPLDSELILKLTKEHDKIVTVEEHVIAGGFGSSVLELLNDKDMSTEVKRLGVNDEFVDHNSREQQLAKYELDDYGLKRAFLSYFSPPLDKQDRQRIGGNDGD